MASEARKEQWRKAAAKIRANRTEEQRAAHNADTLARRNRQRHDPEHRERYLAGDRKYDRAKKAEADRKRNATPEAKERRRAVQRERYARLKDDPNFRAKRNARSAENYRANPAYYVAKGSESARRKARTFGTLSPEHKAQVIALYEIAKRISDLTGTPHEVDHIEPLKGKNACGLHVPWNMRVITKEENREKGNKTPWRS